MTGLLRSALALTSALIFSLPAAAGYLTYFGEDSNAPGEFDVLAPLAATPNSDAAQTNFLAKLKAGIAVETFESIAPAAGPLPITLGSVTATLSGGGGQVIEVAAGTHNNGQYSIPSASSKMLWSASAGTDSGNTFEIAFDKSVAAFGFYGIDIGDFGADVVIELLLNGNVLTAESTAVSDEMKYTKGNDGSTDGSVFFFGFVAGESDSLFNGIRFRSTSTQPDGMGFDNFTVALRSDLKDACTDNCGGPDNPIPEPGSIALVGLALVGLRWMTRAKS